MQITATEAKNRFGYYCAQAKRKPVLIAREGKTDTVLLSIEAFEALRAQREHAAAGNAGLELERAHQAWFDEQNRIFDEIGVFGEDLRPW